ncbi:hypothetical protein SAMN04488550_4172 [Gordonia malaquae]|uniref:Uncharacterized protein n=1 Tax=Gordonia malaquae NBRC 108250 TaxID=1223542 RepID=M3VH62_GORML|nr:hypothetical protein [Gordonia malaquae]GAC81674.1 hypothetical protein GM1_041_00450 [Gordonia malaquae NBRC 108250]SEE26430.1 hypothetical protein SAMN04488550_4172 [Gordonia malaquae]
MSDKYDCIRECPGHPLGIAPLGPSWVVDIPGQPRYYSDGWHFGTREDAEEYVDHYMGRSDSEVLGPLGGDTA